MYDDIVCEKRFFLFIYTYRRDRCLPVHEGFSLPAYMIRLMTSTMMPLTRDGVCETLYVLCDKDGNIYVSTKSSRGGRTEPFFYI